MEGHVAEPERHVAESEGYVAESDTCFLLKKVE